MHNKVSKTADVKCMKGAGFSGAWELFSLEEASMVGVCREVSNNSIKISRENRRPRKDLLELW